MKRATALLLAALMCLSLGTAALAAGSPTTAWSPSEVTGKDGKPMDGVEVKVETLSGSNLTAAEAVKEDVSKVEGLGSDWNLATDIFDVSVTNTVVDASNPVTITFHIESLKGKSNVRVIHYANGAWVSFEPDDNDGNGNITVTFTSLSPVGFVVKDEPKDDNKPGTKPAPTPSKDSGNKKGGSNSNKKETSGGGATGTSAINNTAAKVVVNGEEKAVTSLRVLSDIPEVQRFKNRIAANGLGVVSPSLAGQTLLGLYDVTLDGYTGGQATITFNVPGVKAGDVVTVIQYVDYEDAWKLITPNSVGDGTVSVTLTSLNSPIGFVVNRAAAAPAAGVPGVVPGVAATGATSPKTGE